MPTNAINDTGVKYLYDKLHGEIEPVAEAVSDSEVTIKGNPLSFNTLSSQNAKSTILSVEPIQDLHGYDKPWVGGAGKNKCSANSFSLNRDSQRTKETNIATIPAGNYTVSWVYNGTSTDTRIYFRKQQAITTDQVEVIVSSGNTANVTFTVDMVNIYAFITNAQAAGRTAEITELMVRPSTEPSGFEPYENLCPITGRTEIGISGCGKNIATTQIYKQDYVIASNGSENASTGYCITDKIFIDNTKDYYLTFTKQNPSDPDPVRVGCYDKNGKFLERKGYVTSNSKITFSEQTSFIRLSYANSSSQQSYTYDIQLEENSATEYTPYQQSNDLTISFGETVYGGQVDVERGKVIVDKKIRELTSSDTWYHDERWDNCFHTVWTNDGITPTTYGIEAISSQYTNVIKSVTSLNNGEFIYNTAFISSGSGSFIVKNEKYSTANDFKDSLVNNPIQLCYELGTPITINLTPHTINLLKGVNNISTDGDSITLTYRDGSVATLEDVKLASENLETQIADAQILTDTVTGDKYKLVITNGALDIQQVSN